MGMSEIYREYIAAIMELEISMMKSAAKAVSNSRDHADMRVLEHIIDDGYRHVTMIRELTELLGPAREERRGI